jgi:hypothetical protein
MRGLSVRYREATAFKAVEYSLSCPSSSCLKRHPSGKKMRGKKIRKEGA